MLWALNKPSCHRGKGSSKGFVLILLLEKNDLLPFKIPNLHLNSHFIHENYMMESMVS